MRDRSNWFYSAWLPCFLVVLFFTSCSSGGTQKQTPSPSFDSTIAKGNFFTVTKHFDVKSKTWYILTKIDHEDSSGNVIKLRLSLTDKNKPMGETGSEFASRTGYTLVFNASQTHVISTPSGEKKIPEGIQIINGNIIFDSIPHFYTLGIKDDNELVAYPPGITGQEILKDGTNTALTAFAPLIEDHKSIVDKIAATIGARTLNGTRKDPRQIIAQLDNLDILFLTCGGRGYGGTGMTTKDVARILNKLNVKFAFNLDGGGSITTVVNGKFLDWEIDTHGTAERPRSTFLYVK